MKIIKGFASVLLLGAVFAGGYVSHHPHTVTKTIAHTQDDVTSFNDGWNTALYGDGTTEGK